MEWYQKALESMVQHGPLVILGALAYWKITPELLKISLKNGSGDLVRTIVREENHKANIEQSGHMAITLKATIERHEEVEQTKLHEVVKPLTERIGKLEARIAKKRMY
jgi:hypothetical protein